jgi:small nuclear ribonucleoprotein (snRNP)-like protein
MKSAREKSLLCNTLIGIVKSCELKRIQIDLRNESSLIGRVESVSMDMNVIMSNVTMINPLTINSPSSSNRFFKELTVRGNNIRFIHIPDEIDMLNCLQHGILSVKRGNQSIPIKKNRYNKQKHR